MRKYFIIILFILLTIISCSINSSKPEVVSTSIKEGDYISNIEKFNSIKINFSQPMNRYVTESGITIDGYYGNIYFKWQNGNKSCILYLYEKLERGNMYTLEIAKSCESKNGIDMGKDKKYRFYTYINSDEFNVTDTYPTDGTQGVNSDIQDIAINFSLPVEKSSIYDKIEISPDIKYYYSFSEDCKIIYLTPISPIEKNTLYKITIKNGLLAESGKRLEKEYSFSFSTIYTEKNFELLEAVMVNKGDVLSDPHITINTDYLSETSNVNKDMELILIFNNDFYLNSLSDHISIEPSISYYLTKEDKDVRISFDKDMASEEIYTISIDSGFKDTDGKPMNSEYKFSWITNGDKSKYLRPLNIHIKDPNGINDTLIYSNGEYYQNENMLLQSQIDHQEVIFEVEFSSSILVYRALGFINLNFMFGNSQATSGEIINYSLSSSNNTLMVTYSLPIITSGQNAYYRFELKGGEDGIVDANHNPLEEDILIYTIYDVQ